MEPFRYVKDVEKKELFKGVWGQYLGSGQNMNVMHWNFADNVILPEHSHESEQFGYVIKGAFKATIAGVTRLLFYPAQRNPLIYIGRRHRSH